jgi:uncharacterized protein
VTRISLDGVPVVDAHTHPYRIEDLLAQDPAAFDTRSTFLGTCYGSSANVGEEAWGYIDSLTDTTMLGIAMRHWLAGHLGVEATREAVAAARAERLREDPIAYTKELLATESIQTVVGEEGYPQPTVPREEYERALGVPVYRVVRIEPLIVAHRERGFDELIEGMEADLDEAAEDPKCIGYKSIIAYRTGLDVEDPTVAEARDAYGRWRDDGFAETRTHAKPVRDYLIRRALGVAKRRDRVFHLHCGGGDPDIDPRYARPSGAMQLLVDHQDQPIILIHAGYPWILEASYIANILPMVHLELSELVPWSWSQVEWALEMLVGSIPAAKIMHGTDQASKEPEVIWAGARLVRGSLERVLGSFVDRGYCDTGDAERLGRGVLGENVLRLHGIAGGPA